MKGFPPKNRLNNCFGRNAIRLLGVLFLVSLLTPRHFASGETVRFAGDSDLIGDAGRWTRAVAEEWAEKTNNTSNTLAGLLMQPRRSNCIYSIGEQRVEMWTCTCRRYLAGNCGFRMPLI